MRNILILCSFIALLGACGSKGPLILPPPPAKAALAASPAGAIDDSTAAGARR